MIPAVVVLWLKWGTGVNGFEEHEKKGGIHDVGFINGIPCLRTQRFPVLELPSSEY